MIPKLIIGVALTLALVMLAFYTRQQAPWAERNSIKQIARQAKAEGKKAVKMAGPTQNYAGRNIDFSTALSSFSLVTAEAVENKSYSFDTNDILTWYKFRLLETISAKPTCTTCMPASEIPLDAAPLRTDEFVVINSGGTLNIDGVGVTVENKDFPPFVNGQKYLLFVSFTPSKVTLIAGGPSGVFRIKGNDDLEALESSRPIAEAIEKRFGRKLTAVKSHIKN